MQFYCVLQLESMGPIMQSLPRPAPQPGPVLLQDRGAMPQCLVLSRSIRTSQNQSLPLPLMEVEKCLNQLLNEKSNMYLSCQN